MKFVVMICVSFVTWQAMNSMATAAILPAQVSDAEMTRLPAFCAARMRTPLDSPESRAWRAQIGQNYLDIHHYCAGLNYVNRYWAARSNRESGYYLQRAEANFSYVVQAIKPDFTMGAELFTNRAEVYKLMNKAGDAVRDLTQAIAIDPTLVRPYLQLADVYSKNKNRRQALETVTSGLRHSPESTALQRLYLELGGKEPFPEPVVSKAAEKAPEPVAPSESKLAVQPAETPPQPAAQTEAAPVIGTPKNPYCRFCPPE